MAVFLAGPYSTGCACSREKCSDDCSFYRKYKPKPKPITHFDEIKAMSVEEMAEWIDHIQADAYERGMMETPVVDYPNVYSGWLDWLKQEVDDG